MPALISIEQFRRDVHAKRDPKAGVFRVTSDDAVPVEGAARTLRFCFSDGSVDRMGDTIDPNGWDVADFTRNPVALWAHDSFAPPIGRAGNVGVEGDRLMGDIEFVPAETYAFADTVFRLVTGRFIKAVSVGFLPIEYSFVENDPKRGWGIDFKRQQLLEISVCPVPANPNALEEARAKGIDTRPLIEWAERALEAGGRVILPRTELERLHKAAKEPPMTRRIPRSRFRADGASEDDPTSGGEIVGNCGRKPDEQCGMKDPEECAIHRSAAAGGEDPDSAADDEKTLRRLLARLLRPKRRAGDDDPDGDEDLPLAHEDAIRLAHKCMRTAKTFYAEALGHHVRALDLLGDVVDALDGADPDDEPNADPNEGLDDPDGEKADRTRRAAARRRRLAAA